MKHQVHIIFNHLKYTTNNQKIFENLTLAFGKEKTAIIGKNGVGKSTLLKLITKELFQLKVV
jgi:ATPase components of ABC transporters with duplicated ATPase domains